MTVQVEERQPMRTIARCMLVAVIWTATRSFGEDGEERTYMGPEQWRAFLQTVRQDLAAHVSDLPQVAVNTNSAQAGFQLVDLSRTLRKLKGWEFRAFRFTTPDKIGDLVLSFRWEMDSDYVNFELFPAKGQIANYQDGGAIWFLSRDIPGLGEMDARFILHCQPKENLKPNTEYVVWVNAETNAKLLFSINMVPSFQELGFGFMFPLSEQEISGPTGALKSFIKRRYVQKKYEPEAVFSGK